MGVCFLAICVERAMLVQFSLHIWPTMVPDRKKNRKPNRENMGKKLAALLLFCTVAGCARLEGGNWPSLHEGFTPREAPMAAPIAEQDTGAAAGPEVVAQAVPMQLANQIGDARAQLEKLLVRAEANSGEETGVGTSRELGWYESQLELSRMGRFIDMLKPYPDALADLESFLQGARQRLAEIEPDK